MRRSRVRLLPPAPISTRFGELAIANLLSPLCRICAVAFYRYADRMLRMLGETGTSVLIRLSAFILLCIGVQIFWTGASALLATLPVHG